MKLVIADDHPMVRFGIRHTLSQSDEHEVLGEANTTDEVLSLLQRSQPDALILDIEMPGIGADEVCARALQLHPKLKILILSVHNNPQILRKLTKVKIAGYLLKDEAPESLLQALHALEKGAAWFSHPVAANILSLSHQPAEPSHGLSDRERQILGFVGLGLDNATIADKLALAEQTVRNYVSAIYTKLGVATRPELVVYAQNNGLTER